MFNTLGRQYPAFVSPAWSEPGSWIRTRELQSHIEHPCHLAELGPEVGIGGKTSQTLSPLSISMATNARGQAILFLIGCRLS